MLDKHILIEASFNKEQAELVMWAHGHHMNVTAEGTSKMNEMEACVNDIVAQYGHLKEGEETQAEDIKRTVQDFLEYGPGMPEQRRQALFKHMKGWDPKYKSFLTRRDRTSNRCE